MTAEFLDKIQYLGFFENLPTPLTNNILHGSAPISFSQGQSIAFQGDPADSIQFILGGLIKVTRLFPEGKEIMIRLMSAGDVILTDLGKTELCPYEESFVTIKNTQLVSIAKTHLQNCMSAHPEIARAMFSITHKQTQCHADEITLVKWQHLPQRVASFLLGLCPAGKCPVQITLPYEKTLIAARLGTTRESLSRAFNELRKVDVEVNRMQVCINDVVGLQIFSEASSQDLRTRCERDLASRQGHSHQTSATL